MRPTAGSRPVRVGWVLTTQERRRRTAVQIDEVKHHLHPQTMRRGDEVLEVLIHAILLVDVEVVGDAILVLRVVEAAADLARTPGGFSGTVPKADGGTDPKEALGTQLKPITNYDTHAPQKRKADQEHARSDRGLKDYQLIPRQGPQDPWRWEASGTAERRTRRGRESFEVGSAHDAPCGRPRRRPYLF